MIKENIVVSKKEAEEFEPLSENIYQVEILDVDVSTNETYDSKQKKTEGKEYEKILSFQYTLLAGKDKKGESLRGRNLWDNFIPSYLYISSKNGKNKLYRIIEAVLGREITQDEEVGGIDAEFLNNLIGKQLRVGTINKESKGKVFSNANSYYGIEAEMPSLTDEEKEKATVKNKKEEKADETDEDVINIDDVPFEKNEE